MTRQLSSNAGRWTLQGLLAASVVGLGVAGLMTQFEAGSPAEATQVEEQAAGTLDVDTYYAVDRLRSELGLTHRDLCAAGCDTAATHAALTNLLSWYETNRASLYTARNEVLAAHKSLYEASRSGDNEGPSDNRSLHQAIDQARQTLEQVQGQAITQAESAFTPDQREHLAAARTNTDIIGNLRYVTGLSTTQKQRITEAQEAGANSDEALSAAGLSFSQQQELATIRDEADLRSLQVAAGEATALPVPASILAERAADDSLSD